MRPFQHFVERMDGVRRVDGTLGVAVSAGPLSYLARWEDGTSSRMEQHDPAVTPFDFHPDWEPREDPLYRRIHDDWALWSKAGPRPEKSHADA